MVDNKNSEVNKAVSFIKENSIKAISQIEEAMNKEGLIKDFEEIFDQVRGPLCEQLEKLKEWEISEGCDKQLVERAGKLNADIYVSCDENHIITSSQFWPRLMDFILMSFVMDESHYIEFSCFDSEEEVINEVKENLEAFELKNDCWCDQIWIKGKFNEEIRKMLLENYLTDEGRIKWFVIILTSDDKKSKSLSMTHYGTELYISGLIQEDVNIIENIFSFDKDSVRWSED